MFSSRCTMDMVRLAPPSVGVCVGGAFNWADYASVLGQLAVRSVLQHVLLCLGGRRFACMSCCASPCFSSLCGSASAWPLLARADPFSQRGVALALQADGPVALGLAFSEPSLGRRDAGAPSARACSRSCVVLFFLVCSLSGEPGRLWCFHACVSSIPAWMLAARQGVFCRFAPAWRG